MKRYLVVFVAGIALAAAFGVVSASAHVGTKAAVDLVPPYPGALRFRLGDEVTIDSRSRTLSYAVATAEPRVVADYYDALWKTQGFAIDRYDAGNEARVTARAPRDPFLRTVIVSGDGARSFIIGSTSTVLAAAENQSFAPVPEACEVETRSASRDLDARRETTSLACKKSLAETLAALSAHLGKPKNELRTPDTAFVVYKNAVVIARAEDAAVTRAVMHYEDQP